MHSCTFKTELLLSESMFFNTFKNLETPYTVFIPPFLNLQYMSPPKLKKGDNGLLQQLIFKRLYIKNTN